MKVDRREYPLRGVQIDANKPSRQFWTVVAVENAILPAGSDASAYQRSQFGYIHQDRLDKERST